LVLAAVLVALTACTASHHSSLRIYGKSTQLPLVIAAAAPSDHPLIDAATARRTVEQPTARSGAGEVVVLGLPPGRHLVFFGLGRVSTYRLTADGTRVIPVDTNRLAWVGVYQLGSIGQHSCVPPQGPVPTLPPVQKHYYEAVIVDPTTGQPDFWTEDASGQVLRDCGYTTKH
jgi:hypothetical protein